MSIKRAYSCSLCCEPLEALKCCLIESVITADRHQIYQGIKVKVLRTKLKMEMNIVLTNCIYKPWTNCSYTFDCGMRKSWRYHTLKKKNPFWPDTHLFNIKQETSLLVSPSLCLSVYLSVYLCVCRSVCLYLSISRTHTHTHTHTHTYTHTHTHTHTHTDAHTHILSPFFALFPHPVRFHCHARKQSKLE